MRLLAVLLLVLPLLAACGKKGPLYLPSPERPAPTRDAGQ